MSTTFVVARPPFSFSYDPTSPSMGIAEMSYPELEEWASAAASPPPSYFPTPSPQAQSPRRSKNAASTVKPEVPTCFGSHSKPHFTYLELLCYCIEHHPGGRMALIEIYNWMTEKIPYFRTVSADWRNSIRHNLSVHKDWFSHEARSPTSAGRGGLWMRNYTSAPMQPAPEPEPVPRPVARKTSVASTAAKKTPYDRPSTTASQPHGRKTPAPQPSFTSSSTSSKATNSSSSTKRADRPGPIRTNNHARQAQPTAPPAATYVATAQPGNTFDTAGPQFVPRTIPSRFHPRPDMALEEIMDEVWEYGGGLSSGLSAPSEAVYFL
ncbi:hypothetical protein HKX48_008122 [Thoreauomyces humboldtii]|nr:hypothetical protein HKX48_008122 [Thoreauomyces humboldtii]